MTRLSDRGRVFNLVRASETFLRGKVGQYDAPPELGDIWTWTGEAVRLDADGDALASSTEGVSPLLLNGTGGAIAHSSRFRHGGGPKLAMGSASTPPDIAASLGEERVAFPRITVSDGARKFCFDVLAGALDGEALLCFTNGLPPRRLRLEVVAVDGYEDPVALPARPFGSSCSALPAGVLAEVPLATPSGSIPATMAEAGMELLDHAGEPVEIAEVHRTEFTGARLAAYPHLWPLCLQGEEGTAVRLAPGQPLLLEGAGVVALTGSESMAVPIGHLRNAPKIRPVSRPGRKVVYVDLVLERPAIVEIAGHRLCLRGKSDRRHPYGMPLADALEAELIIGLGMGVPATSGNGSPLGRQHLA